MDEIYRIVDVEKGEEVSVYFPPSAREQTDFRSVEAARSANCHGTYKDKIRYKIRKYKLVPIDNDCDPATEEDYARVREEELEKKSREAFAEMLSRYTHRLY